MTDASAVLPTRRLAVAVVMLALTLPLTLLAACGRSGAPGSGQPSATVFRGTYSATGYSMPDLTLTDGMGMAYNLRSSPSKPVVLLYFGYVHCPDVCPQVLSGLALTLRGLDPSTADRVQVVVVTVDPARDHPAQLSAWLDRYDPDFTGLTGELAEIRQAAAQVGVDIEGKRHTKHGYEVVHGAQVLAFGRDRTAHLMWEPGTPTDAMQQDLELLVRQQ